MSAQAIFKACKTSQARRHGTLLRQGKSAWCWFWCPRSLLKASGTGRGLDELKRKAYGLLHSQRDTLFRILATLENPDALPALEVLAADGTDAARADAARAGVAYLKAAPAARQKGR